MSDIVHIKAPHSAQHMTGPLAAAGHLHPVSNLTPRQRPAMAGAPAAAVAACAEA